MIKTTSRREVVSACKESTSIPGLWDIVLEVLRCLVLSSASLLLPTLLTAIALIPPFLVRISEHITKFVFHIHGAPQSSGFTHCLRQ